ncbi:MAG: cytochrome ubiquinol oxidase subunit I [Chloroflexota bacterium]
MRAHVPAGLGQRDHADDLGISIPCLLSFLAYQDVNATVQGINSFCACPDAPINLLFQVYHVTIELGPILAGSGSWRGSGYVWRRRIFRLAVRALAAGPVRVHGRDRR